MEYKTCDGSVWRMSYPHPQHQNNSGTVIVSHTPVSIPGPSHFDNRITYRGQDGVACYTQLFNSSSQGVVVKFLGGEGERYSWTIPGPPANVQKSFQGFVMTRQ